MAINNHITIVFNQAYDVFDGYRVPSVAQEYPHNPYAVMLAGREFMVDTSFEPYRREAFRHKSLSPQRESVNLTNIAGEGTVNTEGLWRREQKDYSMGAGQKFLDRARESAENRFAKSKGIDPFSLPYQVTLLKDTTDVWDHSTAAPTKLIPVSAGNYTFLGTVSGTTVTITRYTSFPSAGTAVTFTGTAPTALYDMASDGSNVYAATNNGIWKINGTTNTASVYMGVGAIANSTFVLDQISVNLGHNVMTCSSGFPGVTKGMTFTSPAFTGTCKVVAVGPTSITVHKAATSNVSNTTATFTLQASGKTVYSWRMVKFCNDSLIAAATTSSSSTTAGLLFAYTFDPIGTTPDAADVIMDHPNPYWTWTSACSGMSQIYVGGYSNNGKMNTGAVYRISMTGVVAGINNVLQPFALNYPVQCLPLERGEGVYCLYSYLNYVFVGTNKGVRMTQTLNVYDPTATATGDLKTGPILPSLLQPVTMPVTSMTGVDRFVYFTWHNYDSVSTGVGRIDITQFNDNQMLSPVYCSDMMATAQVSNSHYPTLIWDNVSNGMLLTVPGDGTSTTAGGVFVQANTYVTSGTLETGEITFNISEDKTPVNVSFDSNFNGANGASIDFTAIIDDETTVDFANITNQTDQEQTVPTGYRGERFAGVITIRPSTDKTVSPTLYRWTLKAWPNVSSETIISPVLRLFDNNNGAGQEELTNPYEAYMFLENLRYTQQIVEYVEGPLRVNVVVYQLDWLPHKPRYEGNRGFEGDCVVFLKTVGGFNTASY